MAQHICLITITFTLNNDIIAPPFTSKISKTIFIKLTGKEDIIKQKHPYKPITITPIIKNGKPIYKTTKNKNLLKINAGENYQFHLTIINKDLINTILTALIENCNQTKINIFNTKATITNIEITIKKLEELGLPQAQAYRIQFKTPTILQMPKSLKWKFKGYRYVLFPHPYLITYSLINHWNTHTPESLKIKQPWKLSYYATHALMEVDYNIKPTTVPYKGEKGPRGFTGWALYKFRGTSKKLNKKLLTLLEYANFVGIGKSRSIGFGMTKITPIQNQKPHQT